MNNLGGQEQLERLQNCRSALDSILKEQCAFANARLAHCSNYTPFFFRLANIIICTMRLMLIIVLVGL